MAQVFLTCAYTLNEPHEYYYSSARNDLSLDSPLRIASVFDGNYNMSTSQKDLRY